MVLNDLRERFTATMCNSMICHFDVGAVPVAKMRKIVILVCRNPLQKRLKFFVEGASFIDYQKHFHWFEFLES